LKKMKGLKYIYWAFGGFALMVAFNNCGEGFQLQELDNSGSSSLFSRAPGKTCEDALLKVYQSTYHSFVTQTCNKCHVNGPGVGTFANSDLQASYLSFVSIGATRISNQAVNENHQPLFTGTQNTARINELKSFWGQAQTEYASCLSAEGSGGISSFVVKTTGTAVAANLATTFLRMEWDLETQSNGQVPVIAGIEIRKAVLNRVTQGYEFRNPTLRLKTAAAGNYQARALNVYINNQLQTEVTTYSNIEATISTITNTNLAPGSANAYAVLTPASTDTIAIEFSSLKSSSGVPNPGGTPAPPATGTTPTPVGRVTYTQLAAVGGVFANSCFGCHSGPSPRGALNLMDYAKAKLAATNIKSRVNNPNNPMPAGGLLPQAQRDIINAWVDQMAPP
jgi:mono/diheme cytochrome c family protein